MYNYSDFKGCVHLSKVHPYRVKGCAQLNVMCFDIYPRTDENWESASRPHTFKR